MKTERRTFDLDEIRVEPRAAGKPPIIRGHAAVFNRLSEDLGGFREKIAPGAFDRVLGDDVRALFNHDPNMILGRTASGTLRLSQDRTGLRYEIDPPDTQIGRDLTVSVRRGDISQSSFAFVVDEDSFEEDERGRVVRTIKRIKRLLDVSPVTYPAYPDAAVGIHSLRQWRSRHDRRRTIAELKRDLTAVNSGQLRPARSGPRAMSSPATWNYTEGKCIASLKRQLRTIEGR